MCTVKQLDALREALLEAFADYSLKTGGSYDGSGVVQTDGYEKLANAVDIKGTRPRGKSKENCSQHIFEHLKLLRIVKALPSHYYKWITYRYGATTNTRLAEDLIVICMDDLEFFEGRKAKQDHRAAMVSKWVLSNREFHELLQKDIFEAMGVSRITFHRSYKSESDSVSEYWQELDEKALYEIFCALKALSDKDSPEK